MNKLNKKRRQFIFISLLIPVTLLIAFVVFPAIDLFRMSFTDWDGFSADYHFINFENYISMFHNKDLWLSLRNNAVYFVIHLFMILVELAFAVLLTSKLRAAKFYKTMVFLPYIINGVAISYAFSYFFSPINGAFNGILTALHLESLIRNWLSDEKIVNFVLASVSVWRFSGYHVILFMAALQSIPTDILEAARIDGASTGQIFKYIQIPAIMLMVDFVLFDNIRGALQVFDIPYDGRWSRLCFFYLYPVHHQDGVHLLELRTGGNHGSGDHADDRDHLCDPEQDHPRSGSERQINRKDAKHMAKRVIQQVIKQVICIGMVIIVLAPILLTLFASLKSKGAMTLSSPLLPPTGSDLTFENYKKVFTNKYLLIGFKNTIIILAVSLIFNVMLGTITAFIIERFEFRGKKFVVGLFFLGMLIPSFVTEISRFRIINGFHLYNTLGAPIVIYIASDLMQLYIYRQFISGLSVSLDEAALLDGCSYFQLFYKIIFPLLAPATATVCIVKAINIINDMYIPYLYMPKNKLRTITTFLMDYANAQQGSWQTLAAGIIVVMIPTVLTYIFFQKYILAGIAAGAVKE